MRALRAHMFISGPRDSFGRASFTLFWFEPEGVFRPELAKDGKPVGHRRSQQFHAVPEEYTARGATLISDEVMARLLGHEDCVCGNPLPCKEHP